MPLALSSLDLQAAIVDLDGTMVDTLGDFTEALRRVHVDLQLPVVPAPSVERMVEESES